MKAKDLFLKCGFELFQSDSEWVKYVKGSGNQLYDEIIKIYKDGSFEAYINSNNENNDFLDFDADMTMALIEELKEFNLI